MDTVLAIATIISTVVAVVALALTYAQYRRTPKLKADPERFVPTTLTVICAPMRDEGDLPGYRRY